MTSKEFIAKLQDIVNNYRTVYMWGVFGSPVTEGIIREKSKQYPAWYTPAKQAFFISLIGKGYFGFDCIGLIKGILWGWNADPSKYHGGAVYKSNNVPDVSANVFIEKCTPTTNFNTILPGEAVWLPGHIGVYIGDGKVIESTPAWKNGVQITLLKDRRWLKHGKLPWIKYEG